MTITLLEKWDKYKKGAVLYVLRPHVTVLDRRQLRHKKCSGQVDVGRAESMVAKGLAVDGRITKKRSRKGLDDG